MRTGKGSMRFGDPSQAFLDRKASRDRTAAEAKASSLPRTGDVHLFLDDERLPREGWTLVRTPQAFLVLIDNPDIAPRVRRISLDWHLGAGQPDGDTVAKELATRLADPGFLPNLEAIHFHSSVRDKALGMMRTIWTALGERGEDVLLGLGKPWEER